MFSQSQQRNDRYDFLHETNLGKVQRATRTLVMIFYDLEEAFDNAPIQPYNRCSNTVDAPIISRCSSKLCTWERWVVSNINRPFGSLPYQSGFETRVHTCPYPLLPILDGNASGDFRQAWHRPSIPHRRQLLQHNSLPVQEPKTKRTSHRDPICR